MNVEERNLALRDVFARSLGIAVEQVTDDLEYNKVKEWDSVAHMALVAAIDQAFDIMLETEDVLDLSSFAKAKAIVAKYGG